MAHTTKFGDYLNKLLKSRDEDSVVQEFSFIATENKIRQHQRLGILGTLIRKKDEYAFSEMENRYKRGEAI